MLRRVTTRIALATILALGAIGTTNVRCLGEAEGRTMQAGCCDESPASAIDCCVTETSDAPVLAIPAPISLPDVSAAPCFATAAPVALRSLALDDDAFPMRPPGSGGSAPLILRT